MEVLFKCLQDGKRFYEVRRNGTALFVGTRDECGRYIGIHNQKVARAMRAFSRDPKSGAVEIRTYRATRAHA